LILPTSSWPPVLQFIAFPLALMAGAAASGAVGYVIGAPTLRLKGDYLAIVTLAFGELAPTSLASVEAQRVQLDFEQL
jgi:branched-chain amino acid transport system permease protein